MSSYREDVIARLKELALVKDYEETHAEADGLLCELLRRLGYQDVVEAFAKLRKWYA